MPMPMPTPSSSSLSLSHSSLCFPFPFTFSSPDPPADPPLVRRVVRGVSTLTPGILPLRAGVPKISARSSGAASGLESMSSAKLPRAAGVFSVLFSGLWVRWGRCRPVLWGVAWMRYFLSRTRWRRMSCLGVRWAVRAVEGGAKGEDWGSDEWG